MRLYSTHFRAQAAPVLVKEGFSWPCLFLGWIGLLLSASWIAGLLAGAVFLAFGGLLRPLHGMLHAVWPVFAGLQVLLALFANDLRRWELGLRGFVAGPLVSGHDADAALVRLLDLRPDLYSGTA
ncbi:hypothetical protein [Lichenicoccus sp.]|uniref:hypothetical protein n=1 Tax=Lichenicoccus sp. TaxID=2781899 RepID=UPI003D146585